MKIREKVFLSLSHSHLLFFFSFFLFFSLFFSFFSFFSLVLFFSLSLSLSPILAQPTSHVCVGDSQSLPREREVYSLRRSNVSARPLSLSLSFSLSLPLSLSLSLLPSVATSASSAICVFFSFSFSAENVETSAFSDST